MTFNARANDSDPDLDAIQIAAIGAASHGSAVLNQDGTITYTPGANYHGGDSLTYTLTDAYGRTSTGTVSIVVAAVNDAPVAANDSYATDEDTPLTVARAGRAGQRQRRRRRRADGRARRRAGARHADAERQRLVHLHAGGQLQRPRQLHLQGQRRRGRQQHRHGDAHGQPRSTTRRWPPTTATASTRTRP